MNRTLNVVGMVAVMLVAGSGLYATEASLSLDFASAYVLRGVIFNDGAVTQLGLEVSDLGGLTVGAWGNVDIDDYDGALEGGQMSEIDVYASYDLPLEDPVAVSVGIDF